MALASLLTPGEVGAADRSEETMTSTSTPVGTADGVRTIAAHLSTAVPIADPEDRTGTVLAAMRGRQFDSVAAVAVCRDGVLLGTVTVERLLAADADLPMSTVMDTTTPPVPEDADQEQAAGQAVHHGHSTLAVVDADGRFRGLVPPRRLLAVLLAEHDQDVARLGGFLGSAAAARSAATESVRMRLWHRLPWLLLGLVGALAAAGIVGAFERQLSAQVLIAFFVPGVVYLADAVGTQTEAVAIRGLAAGVGIGRIARREAFTGVVLGLLFAVLTFPLVGLIWQDAQVAAAVAVALFAASSVATVIALVLPWVLDRAGRDPAFGSGPLATVIQDLLSLAIYFAAATAIVS
jgi:magnesium transporter